MTEKDFQEVLQEALVLYMEDGGVITKVTTFGEAGLLTINGGLVVTTTGGEFQLTIVKR